MEKYGTAGHVTDGHCNTAHALCNLNKEGYSHTQNIEHLLLIHGNDGCANALQYYLYTHSACLVKLY